VVAAEGERHLRAVSPDAQATAAPAAVPDPAGVPAPAPAVDEDSRRRRERLVSAAHLDPRAAQEVPW
jgi:hypothetical protein